MKGHKGREMEISPGRVARKGRHALEKILELDLGLPSVFFFFFSRFF